MLGQLLLFAIHARPSPEALAYYARLGFREMPQNDVHGGPYAVVSDSAVTLGLQAEPADAPVPIFVRPDLKTYLRGLRRHGVKLDVAELKDDEFNRATFRDPNGLCVMLVEARTFSPGGRDASGLAACGKFLELSVATRALRDTESFWTALGFKRVAQGATPHAWVRLAGHGLTVGFHETIKLASGLSFLATDLEARLGYLRAKKFAAERGAPIAAAGVEAATLMAPEKTPLYLVEREHPT